MIRRSPKIGAEIRNKNSTSMTSHQQLSASQSSEEDCIVIQKTAPNANIDVNFPLQIQCQNLIKPVKIEPRELKDERLKTKSHDYIDYQIVKNKDFENGETEWNTADFRKDENNNDGGTTISFMDYRGENFSSSPSSVGLNAANDSDQSWSPTGRHLKKRSKKSKSSSSMLREAIPIEQTVELEFDSSDSDISNIYEDTEPKQRRKLIICEICGHRVTEQKMPIHQEFHQNGDVYKCPECSKTSINYNSFMLHCRKHGSDKDRYQCNECEFKTHDGHQFRKHRKRTHGDGQPFPCPQCERRFFDKSRLRMHVNHVHNHVRRYACSKCEKCFKTNACLTVHSRIHTDQKPLKCELCDYAARQKTALNWHLRKTHGMVIEVGKGGRPKSLKPTKKRETDM